MSKRHRDHCLALALAGVLTCAHLTLAVRTALAASGELDSSFGTGGIVTTPVGSNSLARAVVVQPDGNIVVAGAGLGPSTDFALVRYLPNGALDSTFGSGGIVTTSLSTGSDTVIGLVLQADGKLVAAGVRNSGSTSDVALARYDAAGVLDPTFGSGGLVTTVVSAQSDAANSVALQADGKIVIGGTASGTFSSGSAMVARYNADGGLDATFDGDGIVTTSIRSLSYFRDVIVQGDGKIVAAGWASFYPALGDFALARYDGVGMLDGAFGTGGITTTDVNGADEAYRVRQIASNELVVAGPVLPSGDFNLADFGLARYTTAGILDGTFGTGGISQTPIGPSTDRPFGLALQSDGKLIVAGETRSGGDADVAVVRYLENGTLDSGFGIGGIALADFGSTFDVAYAAAVQSDGRIVVAGGNGQITVARFRVDGDPLPSPTPTATTMPTATRTPTATPGCAAAPLVGCRTPAVPEKATLLLKKGATADKDQVRWKWSKGAFTTKAEFGSPLATTYYQFCVYDGAGIVVDATIPAGGTCSGKPCWKETRSGYQYKSKDLAPHGVAKLGLKEGASGKAQVSVQGKGALLALPALPISTSPLTAQLVGKNGTCFSAVYSFPPVQKNDSKQFKDKAD